MLQYARTKRSWNFWDYACRDKSQHLSLGDTHFVFWKTDIITKTGAKIPASTSSIMIAEVSNLSRAVLETVGLLWCRRRKE